MLVDLVESTGGLPVAVNLDQVVNLRPNADDPKITDINFANGDVISVVGDYTSTLKKLNTGK